MRRSKEIVILLVLLVGTMAFVLWYVAQRKARNKAEAARPIPAATTPPANLPPGARGPEPVDLAGPNNRKTIDFSSGQPVVKDSAEDKAAMDTALKDMAAAVDDVSFGPTPNKKTEPATATPPPKS
jgi:hypothetical protein